MAVVKEIADRLNTNHRALLNDCLPNIFVHILPLNAASRDPLAATTVRRQIKTAAECYDLLINELGKEVSNFRLSRHIHVYKSIKLDHDSALRALVPTIKLILGTKVWSSSPVKSYL
jgi:hypothetical protein